MTLTPKQQRFVEEYLIDLNGTQAAIRTGYSKNSANEQASQLLAKLSIQNAIIEAQTKRSERTQITQDMVLKQWWAIATANPNDLIQFRRINCRYCYGIKHEYQWTEREFKIAMAAAKEQAERNKDKEDADIKYPEALGGFGFDKTADPNPDCPQCFGEGEGHVYAKDTRYLTGDAKLLYAGVKQTREGFELKLRNQDDALENVANHLGMFTEKKQEQKTKIQVQITRPANLTIETDDDD